MAKVIRNKAILYLFCLFLLGLFTVRLQAQSWSPSYPNLFFTAGYVGIGTSTMTSRLTLNTYGWANSLELNNGYGYSYRINAASDGLLFKVNGSTSSTQPAFCFRSSTDTRILSLFNDGHVNIGYPPGTGSYLLNVGGNIRANMVVVNTTGADFVFDTSYTLLPLNDLEKYVNVNKHLPELETAEEMQKNGINIGETQTKLLQKIEELTLYIIDQNKRIRTLEENYEKSK